MRTSILTRRFIYFHILCRSSDDSKDEDFSLGKLPPASVFRLSKRLSSAPQEGPNKRAREMSLDGGAGSSDVESSNASTVGNEGGHSFVFVDCREVCGEWFFSFLSSLDVWLLVVF